MSDKQLKDREYAELTVVALICVLVIVFFVILLWFIWGNYPGGLYWRIKELKVENENLRIEMSKMNRMRGEIKAGAEKTRIDLDRTKMKLNNKIKECVDEHRHRRYGEATVYYPKEGE